MDARRPDDGAGASVLFVGGGQCDVFERLGGLVDVVFSVLPLRSIKTDPGLKWYAGAGISGEFAFITYFAALYTAPVIVVIPIFASTPLLVVLFSAVLMPRKLERVTWRVAFGAVAVAIGVALVTVNA